MFFCQIGGCVTFQPGLNASLNAGLDAKCFFLYLDALLGIDQEHLFQFSCKSEISNSKNLLELQKFTLHTFHDFSSLFHIILHFVL
jgi:hypothetical protein